MSTLVYRNADNTNWTMLAQYTHPVTGVVWYWVVPQAPSANDLPHPRVAAEFTVAPVVPGDTYHLTADATKTVTIKNIYGDGVRFTDPSAADGSDKILPSAAFLARYTKS